MPARSLESEVRALLKAVAAEYPNGDPIGPDITCASPVCRALGRLERAVDPAAATARRAAKSKVARSAAASNGRTH